MAPLQVIQSDDDADVWTQADDLILAQLQATSLGMQCIGNFLKDQYERLSGITNIAPTSPKHAGKRKAKPRLRNKGSL